MDLTAILIIALVAAALAAGVAFLRRRKARPHVTPAEPTGPADIDTGRR